MKLHARIVLVFAILISIPVTLVALISISTTNDLLVQRAEITVDALAQAKKNELTLFYIANRDRLRGISSRTRMRELLATYADNQDAEVVDGMKRILVDAKKAYDDVGWLAIYDTEERPIASTKTLQEKEIQDIERLLVRASEQEVIFFDNELSQLMMAGPIFRDGDHLGFLAMHVQGDTLERLVANYDGLGETGETLIAAKNESGDAVFLHRRRFEDAETAVAIIDKSAGEVPITQALRRNESSFLQSIDYRGEAVVAATRYLEGPDWGLVVKIDRQELESLGAQFRTTLLILGLIILLFSICIAYAVSTSLVRPLIRLTEKAKQIGKDTQVRDVDIHVDRNDEDNEIGTLSRTFKSMVSRLYEANESLEKRVQDRTETLQSTVEKIEAQNSELENTKLAMLNLMEDLEEEQSKIKEEKAKDEAILESIGDGLVVTDTERRVLLVNTAAEKLLHVSPGDLEGSLWPEALGKDAVVDENGKPVASEQLPVSVALKEGQPIYSSHLSFKNLKTGAFPVAITAAPITQEENIIGTVVAFRDISKEREIDKAKTEFVSLASHQLRTPLSTINWYAEMLLAEDAGSLKKAQREYLDQIYKGNQRMVALVNALLSVSRIELGTFSVEPKDVDVVALAKEAVEEIAPLVKQRKQNLITKFQDGLPHVYADPKLLMIVFQNFLSNAMKYTPKGGDITMSISLQKAMKHTKKGLPAEHFLFTFADTGYGIPKKQQAKIFTKLFRADNVREKDTEGTGLGLYIVKSIIDHSDGRLWFESEEGKGTTFYVAFPKKGMQKKKGDKEIIT